MAKSKAKSQFRPINKPAITPKPVTPAAVDTPPRPARQKPMVLPPAVRIALAVLAALIAAVPAYRYYTVVLNNAINMPFEDDFDSGLKFIATYSFQVTTLAEKLKLLFSQHNEHRIVLNRIVFLTDYGLFGQINLRHMILIGNLSLVLVLGLLLRSSFGRASSVQKLVYFLPVPFLLFQLHYWELTVWGMASVQNLYIFVFALLSFYALSRSVGQPVWFGVACTMAVVATFTSGNGLFTFLVGIPTLVLMKQYRQLGIWLVVAVVTISLYFWGYQTPGHHPPVFGTLLTAPGQFFDYLFTLTGCDINDKPDRAIVAGKWMLAVFAGLVGWNAYRNQLIANQTILMLLGFVYITCLSVTAARSGFGVVQALSPRYGILPVMLLIGLYLLSIETIQNRYARPAVLLLGLALGVYLHIDSFQKHLPQVADRTTTLSYSTALHTDNPDNLILYWGDGKQAKVIFMDAIKKGIYHVPAITLNDLKSQPTPFDATRLQPADNVLSEAKPFLTHDYLVFYQSWAFINGLPAEKTQIKLIAQGAGGSYAFDVRRHIRYDVVNKYQSMQYLQSGFSGTIKKTDIKPGRYTLWLSLTSPYAQSYVPLSASFDV